MATTPETDAAPVKFAPVADRVEFWDVGTELSPGFRTIDAAGHTCGSVVFALVDEGAPCVGSHFAGMRWGRVVRAGEGYRREELTDQ